MRNLFAFIFFCIFLLHQCSSHTLHLGRTCPDVQAYPNLSIDKILGNWYVVYQVDTSNTCQIWNFSKSTTNSEQLILEESRQLYFLDFLGVDHKQSISANVDIPNPEVPAKMRIRWPTSLTGKADFIIFDTDYDNYMAVFQCDRAGLLHRRDITVLSKTPFLEDMYLKRIVRLMNNADVGTSNLLKISHQKCRDDSKREWNIDSELFGLLPNDEEKAGSIKSLSTDLSEYDLGQVEIIAEGIDRLDRANHQQRKDTLL